MRDVVECDRCDFKAYPTSADVPKYVAAVESVLCPRCREDVAEELRDRDGNSRVINGP